jgi:phospholipid/cholesterol/gamma-HCH transport system substrate-binding protein
MDDTRTFEFKVGTFILIGIGLLFFIVFSIGDIYFAKPGYHIKIQFNFASGIGPSAPVRFAGVGAGHVDGIQLVYDEKDKRVKAEVSAWIEDNVKIETDSDAVINTLGLLGEKYLEIYPGTPGKPFLKNGDMLIGKDPVPMERVTENLAKLTDSITSIASKIEKGEGTIGKLLTDASLYNNLNVITGKISKGEGSIGKLLMEDNLYNNLESFTAKLNNGKGTLGQLLNNDSIYKNFEDFSADLKQHPWKLLARPRGE